MRESSLEDLSHAASLASPFAKRRPIRLIESFNSNVQAEIYRGDALDFLSQLEDASAHLIFLDPPFNLGKEYGKGIVDSLAPAEYTKWMSAIITQSIRVLANGGALYLYHLPAWAIQFGALLTPHLDFRHWIAVSMKNGFVRGNRLYPAHYALLFFTKGTPCSFNRPKIPVDLCACGRSKKDYGGYRGIVDDKGINLSDVWDDISPVRHKNHKRRSANELPSKITDRVVAISGAAGNVFVDPFAGAGSAVLAAARASMRVIACDIVRSNCLLQKRLLKSLESEIENS